MVANRIWILIGKKVSGEATPQELEELQSLVADSGDSIHTITSLEQMWRTVNIESVHRSDAEIDQRWQQFKHKLPLQTPVVAIKKNNKRRLFWLAAASVLIAFAATFTFITSNSVEESNGLMTTIEAPAGETVKKVLPDGSKVWLNARSKLTYKKNFVGTLREVSLVGEAYFDVVKDPNHPFVVNTASLHLRVLGTAFNVRAFANEKKSEAALVHGSIEVTLVNNPDKKIILKPSEKITVRNNAIEQTSSSAIRPVEKGRSVPIPLITLSNIHYKEEDPLPVEAQWIEKKLAFESETLEDIATRMERYYNVNITFQDESVKSEVLSGSFKNETFAEAMEYLQGASVIPFKFKINADKEIIIYK